MSQNDLQMFDFTLIAKTVFLQQLLFKGKMEIQQQFMEGLKPCRPPVSEPFHTRSSKMLICLAGVNVAVNSSVVP